MNMGKFCRTRKSDAINLLTSFNLVANAQFDAAAGKMTELAGVLYAVGRSVVDCQAVAAFAAPHPGLVLRCDHQPVGHIDAPSSHHTISHRIYVTNGPYFTVIAQVDIGSPVAVIGGSVTEGIAMVWAAVHIHHVLQKARLFLAAFDRQVKTGAFLRQRR